MKADKMSISMDATLAAEVRRSAERAGEGVSAWLSEAAAARLRAQALAGFLDDWESEHGALTADEIARAEFELGLVTERSGS